MTLVEFLTGIADSIRYAEGSEGLVPVSEMADRITARASVEDSLVNNTVTDYVNNRVESIAAYALQRKTGMVTASFAKATAININAFYACINLNTVIFGNAGAIGTNCFYGCTSLIALVIRRSDRYCALNATAALTNTPIANGKGYVYVPSALVDTYKANTNWAVFADRIVAIEDYVLQIMQHPTDIEVAAGDYLTAEVVVMAIGVKYQWQISSDGGTWTNSTSSSGTSANYKEASDISHNGKMLRCVIQDMYGGEVITNPVTITVTE